MKKTLCSKCGKENEEQWDICVWCSATPLKLVSQETFENTACNYNGCAIMRKNHHNNNEILAKRGEIGFTHIFVTE